MKPIIEILEEKVSAVMSEVSGLEKCSAIVKQAGDPKFGDYQANGIMALAKQLKTNPRKLAEQVVERLDISDICETPEIAGPGFINLRLKPEFIANGLLEINKDTENLAVEKTTSPKTVVVDFSGPNIAKQMHVGHLRSTIIGDCICRMLKFLGHNVIPQNHIGDWGTQFGKIILALWHICMVENLHKSEKPYYDLANLHQVLLEDPRMTSNNLKDELIDHHRKDWLADSKENDGDGELYFNSFLDNFAERSESLWPALLKAYQYVNWLDSIFKGNEDYKIKVRVKNEIDGFIYKDILYGDLTRHITVMLQKGGKENEQERKAWDAVRRITLDECNRIYRRLTVQLSDSDVRGESFYNDKLKGVVEDLKKAGLAIESDGAMCVFPDGFKNKEGEPLPFIIQKSDGAYLYATTDLAALRYRVNELKADEIIYVTDSRQKLHFEMLFAVAHQAGWDVNKDTEDRTQNTELYHVMFGSVLGENGQPLKTRSGENVKLKELLDEAVERAKNVVEQKNPELSQDQKEKIAQAVGIGAVKYADYSNNRTSDYVFSFDKMLAMEGNTAPYMQYAYARIKSIERKAEGKGVDIATELDSINKLNLNEPTELELAKHLIRYGEAIQSAVSDFKPNYLTAYLYELAQKFSTFYTSCPVLIAEPDQRPTRLLLCDLTARTIRHGLTELLGIDVVEQM